MGKDKEKKDKKEKKEQKSSSPSRSSKSGSQSFPEHSQSSESGSQPPRDQMPHWFPHLPYPPQSPYQHPAPFPSFPASMPSTLPSFPPYPDIFQSPFGSPFPSQLQKPPSYLPPPPLTPGESSLLTDNSSNLHSMLLSWYMAGYHTGVFEGSRQATDKKRKERKK